MSKEKQKSDMRTQPRKFPNSALVTGLLLTAAGFLALLLLNDPSLDLTRLWPWYVLCIGLLLVYRVVLRERRPRTVFPASFIVLSGLLLTLWLYSPEGFVMETLWPLFLTITAASLYIASKYTKGTKRIYLHVPAVTLAAMSLVFLLFSTDLVSASFSELLVRYWPVLLLFLAILSFSIDLYHRLKKSAGEGHAAEVEQPVQTMGEQD